ncbi:hypothetical protein [Virgisporangium aurantiacum]|uniref:Immunity protein 35 n=1 Tax=Virgisporangium aurantiacum TaxID=175570 RepID=A0A8J3ZC95_9ACTN|nr:hypothetical protein [Virgisporangium aurantiacum]GIJ61247.1 hypothetical protein Vau01_087630 [Virgisporangium aurantiacum]
MNVYDIADRLPPIDVLRDRCRALAVLERIQDSGYPYYAYVAWGDDEAALMSNGSGDEYSIVFTDAGVFIRVFDHESGMTPYADDDHALWPGLLDGLPPEFRAHVTEPAFCDEGSLNATAVLWRRTGDDGWHAGAGITFPPSRGPYDTSPDGADRLAILGDDIVDRYVDFARDYYEIEVDRAAVAHVVAMRPLTDAVVRALNPDRDLRGYEQAGEVHDGHATGEPGDDRGPE